MMPKGYLPKVGNKIRVLPSSTSRFLKSGKVYTIREVDTNGAFLVHMPGIKDSGYWIPLDSRAYDKWITPVHYYPEYLDFKDLLSDID